MGKRIRLSLSAKSIDKAVAALQTYDAWVKAKTKELNEQLALIGAQEAAVRFASAMYDGDNDVSVTVSPTPRGWKISAKGKAVCFIEFGAGVYHNTAEPYPVKRPNGVSGIGEYGKGMGKRKTWVYEDADGKHFTHGNPAAMPIWYATKEMEAAVLRIAREVFGG